MGEIFGYFTPGNIIFTFFYTVLYIHLAEMFLAAVKERAWKRILPPLLLFVISFLPNLVWEWFVLPTNTPLRYQMLAAGLRDSFLPANLYGDLDYGLPFMFLGVVLYFAGIRRRQCLVFAGFCVLCFIGWGAGLFVPELYDISYFAICCSTIQLWMVLALPFMCLYNGRRGPGIKSLFYAYYPIHRYVIFMIGSFFV